ncbi:uncharacterized protein BXZ73DRAFT_106102 [Epithele typhae]|uniref:uncharacterized protein n=1 Tax=Epithele typhae TaxID=378194 RepID=UPI002007C229|nr:uncharacterized protein BXZ73DRAFT_106102 [Epithele typhae]KAH9915553.1 hypothetical protein BXZ73DRAFT_106102 [Epithele typhae]
MPFHTTLPSVPENYSLLPNGDRDSLEFGEGDNKHDEVTRGDWSHRPASSRAPSCLTWTLALLVLVAATDGIALFAMHRILDTTYASLSPGELEFASPYHGLDTLYRSGRQQPPTLAPALTLPRLVAQVFPDRPREPAPVGEHEYFARAFGTLNPRERRLHVAPAVHTVAQFRALDFGMDECSLVVHLPGPADPLEGPEAEPFRWSGDDEPLELEVTMLDAGDRPVDVRALSYATRPRAKAGEPVRRVRPRRGEETEVGRFPCKWGTMPTFEVACAPGQGSGCLLDVWTTQNTTYGMYMYQYQTI